MKDNSTINKKKPVPIGINTHIRNLANLPKEGGYGVDYECPTCHTKMCQFLAESEKFCHNCGQAISWGVITFLNVPMSNIFDEARQQGRQDEIMELLIDGVEFYNQSIVGDEPAYIADDTPEGKSGIDR